MKLTELRSVALAIVAIAIAWRVFVPVVDCRLTSSVGTLQELHLWGAECPYLYVTRIELGLTLLHIAFLVGVGVVIWTWPRWFRKT